MKSILLFCPDTEVLSSLESFLSPRYNLQLVGSRGEAMALLGKAMFDYVLADFDLLFEGAGGNDFKSVLRSFLRVAPSLQVIVMTPRARIRRAVMAVKAGASDYVTYPVEENEVKLVLEELEKSVILKSELDYLREAFWKDDWLDLVESQSPPMQRVFKQIRAVAPARTTVLLSGKTGTGKGVMARLIHQHSPRDHAPYISVHCGAIPDTLVESELFGHEKGAFTGALRAKMGKFEIAGAGTIFLDEIATVTPAVQIKLLQVLQDGTYSRVGGETELKSRARVIVATNSDLKQMAGDGTFRDDLYFRLNVFPIKIPALRERPEDIPHIVDTIMKRLSREFQREVREVHPLVMDALLQYDWPGNIRELENLLERAYILETSLMLTPESLPGEFFGEDFIQGATLSIRTGLTLAEARRKAVDDFERQYLKALLANHKGKINLSAKEAGISTRQLNKLMLRYGLRKEDFKS
jgi:DNA-binding NtrC family response regulator